MPVFNERATLEQIVEQVRGVDLTVNTDGSNRQIDGSVTLEREIVIVDDGSTDGTRDILDQWKQNLPTDMQIIYHDQNGGKGAALRTGFASASGDLIVVQDADMEYDPADYEKLLAPILAGEADVVYGSRFLDRGATEAHYLIHGLANRFLTGLSNVLTGLKLTDMETCYKLVPKRLLDQITITENRFGIEPEITAKLAHMTPKPRVVEVAVSYVNRSYEEGKKIGWKDGVSAIRCILKFNLGR